MRQFARDRASTLLGIPLTFGGIAVAVFAIEAMLALAGSIPGIGPTIYSACFLLAFFLSLTAVLTVSVTATAGVCICPR